MPFIELSDVFFIITTLAVVVVSTIAVWIGILLIRTLQNIQHISRTARLESGKIANDVDNLRTEVKKEGMTILHFFHSLGIIFSRGHKLKKKKE